MTTFLEQLKQQAAQSATLVDMTDTTSGGGSSGRPVVEGIALVRLVGYQEIGKHSAKFGNEIKDPVSNFKLVFAVVGGNGVVQNYVKGADGKITDEVDGDPVPTPFYNGTPYTLTPFPFELKTHEKSRAVKLFNQMNWDKANPAKHWYELLGRLFKVKVYAKKTSRGGLVQELDLKTYGVQKPVSEETMQLYSNTVEIPDELYSLFLWDNPTKESWASIKEKRRTDENGKEQPISEYSAEAQCLSATNYQGSKLQAMLEGTDGLPTLVADVTKEAMPVDDEPPFTPDAPSVIPTIDIPAPPAL